MLKKIRKFIEEKKEQYRQNQLKKFYRLNSLLISFYEAKGYKYTANLKAKARIKKIQSHKELNFWYRKMNKYKLAA